MRLPFVPFVLLLVAGCASGPAVSQQADTSSTLVRLCAAQPGDRPDHPGIIVTDEPAAAGDLPALRITSVATGAYLLAHYDAGSEGAARVSAPCLGAQLPLLERELGDDRRNARWWDVVFTQNMGYIPPREEGAPPRWSIAVGADGRLSPSGRDTLVMTIPHEQVHAYQNRARAFLPRWLAEGHARWIEDRIAPLLDPRRAAAEMAARAPNAARHGGPANLALWGTKRPRREAIMRQVSPADRARMEADPDYNPSGVFTYGPDDFEADSSNELLRYIAASTIVDGLSRRHGEERVRAWLTGLTARPQLWTDDRDQGLARSIGETFGEDLNALLVEPAS